MSFWNIKEKINLFFTKTVDKKANTNLVYHCHTLKKITHFCVIFYETISFKNLIFFNIKVEITLNINIIIVKIGIPIIEFIEL